MAQVAIVVDDWKLHIFRPRLTAAGFEYSDGGAFTGDTTILKVETNDVGRLKTVVEKCQMECSKLKQSNGPRTT